MTKRPGIGARFSGGKAKLGNLAPVCDPHHDAVHNDGWTLTIDQTTGATTWIPPGNGEPITTTGNRAPPPPPTPATAA